MEPMADRAGTRPHGAAVEAGIAGGAAFGAAAGGGEERAGGGPRRLALVVFGVACVLGGLVRIWQVRGRPWLEWNDTADFLAGSQAPWSSWELWAGARPAGAPVVLKLVGGELGVYVGVQAAVAAACWAALAASVFTVVAGRRARWLAALAVLALSTTAPVVMWDRSVLSESLAVSLLALVVAAVVQLGRGVTGWRVAATLAALVPWLATRDSHAVVAVIGGMAAAGGLGVGWLRRRRSRMSAGPDAVDARGPDRRRRRPGAAPATLAVASSLLGLAVGVASSHGERHAFPVRNVFEVRVLPYPDRVRWFAGHGMPQAEAFVGPGAREPRVEDGMSPVVYVGDHDPALGPWLDWVETNGRTAFAQFVATHPLYLASEPLRSPERTFNNARGDRGFYAPPDMPRVPLVDRVLALPTIVVLMIASVVGGWAFGRRRWSPALVAGLVTAGLAVPHGLFAWHSDGMETVRHLVVPALQLHLGVLLMVVGTLRGVTSPSHDGVGDGDAGLRSAHG
jgi:hypothetical protein